MPTPDPARILRQHVQTDALLGVEAVPAPPRPNNTTPKPAAPLRDAAGSAAVQNQPRRPEPDTKFSIATPPREQRSVAGPRQTAPQPAPPPPLLPGHVKLLAGLSTADKQQRLADLAAEFEQDARVQATRPPGTNLVFGEGDADAQLMFIGEGPGETEDKLGRPFVGRAGELLDKMITACGLERGGVYIANVVKYRPPGNRTPTPDEVAVQGPYLARQVAIIRPTVLVALGGAAAKFALQTDTGITRLRGQWAHFAHIDPALPIMPTFHPAYLLRSYTTDNRKKVWSDLQEVMAKLGMSPKG